MTTPTLRLRPRTQLSAIAWLRWRMFANSLRSTRGKMEVVSRVIMTIFLGVGGFGGTVGSAFAAWYFVSQGRPEMLAVIFWAVFLFWQLFPVMSTAFTNNPDSGDLLRFPLGYRAYFLIRLAYGSFDPATALGCLWLTGTLLGIAAANPLLLVWALPVVLLSLFPPCTPIVMFLRMSSQMPPAWQIALSMVLMLLSIWGAIWVASRIYRVGILMYGKRATLPEMLRWMRYS